MVNKKQNKQNRIIIPCIRFRQNGKEMFSGTIKLSQLVELNTKVDQFMAKDLNTNRLGYQRAPEPRRAKKFAKLFDHLMVLFPFEPPYFEKEGLTTTFVGHPLFEDDLPPAAPEFLDQHHIPNNATILLAMPGSRVNEINRHMPIYKETFHALKASIPTLHVMIPTFEHLQNTISGHIDTSLDYIHITTNKEQAIAHAHAGLIKSGTSSLEVAKNNIPMVVAYKVSYVSYLIIKQLVKVKYASIVNIVANKEIIPEFLQYDCTSDNLANALTPLLTDEQAQNSQRQALRATLDTLKTKQLPSTEAASTILRLIDTK